MFFYLIHHSTLIEKELDEYMKIIKILLYGGISYIILHATLFIGGSEALLFSLKNYFWLFFFLDIVTIYLLNNKNINIKNLFNNMNNKFKSNNKLKSSLKQASKLNNINNKTHILEQKVEKKVKLVEENEYTSDSDSEIGTDIDFEEFKQSLNL